MLEDVGHEYMEEFFGCCESLLAEDGIFVLQFISIPDERYDEYRRSSNFIKEYIFPCGCLPSLIRVTSAMAPSSKLCVEHGDPLLPDPLVLENKLLGKTKQNSCSRVRPKVHSYLGILF